MIDGIYQTTGDAEGIKVRFTPWWQLHDAAERADSERTPTRREGRRISRRQWRRQAAATLRRNRKIRLYLQECTQRMQSEIDSAAMRIMNPMPLATDADLSLTISKLVRYQREELYGTSWPHQSGKSVRSDYYKRLSDAFRLDDAEWRAMFEAPFTLGSSPSGRTSDR